VKIVRPGRIHQRSRLRRLGGYVVSQELPRQGPLLCVYQKIRIIVRGTGGQRLRQSLTETMQFTPRILGIAADGTYFASLPDGDTVGGFATPEAALAFAGAELLREGWSTGGAQQA
jgi:hypothetical protein